MKVKGQIFSFWIFSKNGLRQFTLGQALGTFILFITHSGYNTLNRQVPDLDWRCC